MKLNCASDRLLIKSEESITNPVQIRLRSSRCRTISNHWVEMWVEMFKTCARQSVNCRKSLMKKSDDKLWCSRRKAQTTTLWTRWKQARSLMQRWSQETCSWMGNCPKWALGSIFLNMVAASASFLTCRPQSRIVTRLFHRGLWVVSPWAISKFMILIKMSLISSNWWRSGVWRA